MGGFNMCLKINCLAAIDNLRQRSIHTDSNDRFAYVTLYNKESGNHRTFRFKKQSVDDSFAPDRIILQLLTGSDNENDYQGIGFLNGSSIQVWRKYVGSQNEKTAEILGQVLFGFIGRYPLEVLERFEVITSGNCFKCGKTLTTPDSVESGIGPICKSKLGL